MTLPRRCTIVRCTRRPLALGEAEDLPQAREYVSQQMQTQGYQPSQTKSNHMDMKSLEESVQKEAIKTAIAQAGLTIALSSIPAVGQGLSAVAGLALGELAKRYQKKTKKHIKKQVDYIQGYAEKRQKELDDAITSAYRKARNEGFRLAISFQSVQRHEGGDQVMLNPYMNGLGDFDGLGIGIVDRLTGKSAYEKAKKKIDTQVRKTKEAIDTETDRALTKIRSPGFTALMAQEIAIAARSKPDFVAMLRSGNIPPPPAKYMTHKTTGREPLPTQGVNPLRSVGPTGEEEEIDMPTEMTYVPIIAAAAAIGAVMILK